ncbi:MAG: hypothetical protein ACI9CD_000043 [Candidatus Deianiraeaceae bacterium]|jgi:hypothetical protein
MKKEVKNMQNNFISHLYDEKNLDILPSIKNGKAPKEELLDIYRNNLFTNLTNALQLLYPRIYKYLGTEKFHNEAKKFIVNNRSQSGNLDNYGQGFLQNNNKFLHDLSQFEWLHHLSYLAKDNKELNVKALQTLEEDQLFNIKFKIHPSCFIHTSYYNFLNKNLQNKLQKRKSHYVVYRQNLTVKAEKILTGEYKFLMGVKEDMTLYEVYTKHKIDIQTCLQKFLTNGILCEFNC